MRNERISADMHIWSAPNQQTVFRQLMRAFSFPGRIETLVNGEALTQTLATLVDREATLTDPQNLLDALTLQRLQAHMTKPEHAQFIVADGSQSPTFEPSLGTLESPEFGVTILLKVTALGEGIGLQLTGPGIASTQALAVSGLDSVWLERRQVWNEDFPLGVDLILIDANSIVALPRTTSAACAIPAAAQGETPWAM